MIKCEINISNISKTFSKRKLLRRDLKLSGSVGKMLDLPLSQTDLGIVSRELPAHVCGQEGTYQVNKSGMHLGAKPFQTF